MRPLNLSTFKLFVIGCICLGLVFGIVVWAAGKKISRIGGLKSSRFKSNKKRLHHGITTEGRGFTYAEDNEPIPTDSFSLQAIDWQEWQYHFLHIFLGPRRFTE